MRSFSPGWYLLVLVLRKTLDAREAESFCNWYCTGSWAVNWVGVRFLRCLFLLNCLPVPNLTLHYELRNFTHHVVRTLSLFQACPFRFDHRLSLKLRSPARVIAIRIILWSVVFCTKASAAQRGVY
ncbi:hypothetical protein GGS21DRAFT_159383 [Xylaria nigripes]|nr:hypothetical protein GGS21DRAFT_159383 [Xylaria nigripes]